MSTMLSDTGSCGELCLPAPSRINKARVSSDADRTTNFLRTVALSSKAD